MRLVPRCGPQSTLHDDLVPARLRPHAVQVVDRNRQYLSEYSGESGFPDANATDNGNTPHLEASMRLSVPRADPLGWARRTGLADQPPPIATRTKSTNPALSEDIAPTNNPSTPKKADRGVVGEVAPGWAT